MIDLFATLYLVLLVLLVLFSWIASAYGLVLPSGEAVSSLLGADSMRWFVRHSVENIAAAPIVQVVLVLIMVSAVRSCGVVRGVGNLVREGRRLPLSRHQQYAARIALVVWGVCLLLVVWGIVAPSGNLLSVTGRIAGGPLSSGWLFILLLVVCVPCFVYGRLSGLWPTERDVLDAFTAEIARCSRYFVTLIVGSQLMAALHYVRLFDLLGWGDGAVTALTVGVYGLPLIVAIGSSDRNKK